MLSIKQTTMIRVHTNSDNFLFSCYLTVLVATFLMFLNSTHAKIVKHVLEVNYFEGSPDGVYKGNILGINGKFPGPTIYAEVGDQLEVDVINLIQDGQNLSIHWHGLHQRNQHFEDGTNLITQCPLKPFNIQRYKFVLETPGTHWYHSHVGSQYTEGLWGILIVQNKPEIYSYDEEFIVTLNDWYHRTAHENEEWHLSPISLGVPPYPDSGMINGLGRYNCDYAALQGRTCNASLQKRQVFEVHQNKTYRVRVINTGAYAMFNFSIDGHKLQPIEVDGVDIISETPLIDIATISSGQRYSFLIRTDENEKRYLMRAYLRVESLLLIVRENVTNINKYPEALDEKVTAVLQYSLKSNSSSNELLKLYTENHSYLDSVPPSPIKDPIYLDETLLSPHDGIYAPDRVDQEFILEIGFYEDHEDIRRGSFNQTPYKLPSDKPLLNYLLDGKEFPEESWSLEIQYMNVIQLVINNPFFGPHPFHLHGHHFWVLGTGAIDDGNYNATKYNLTLTGAKRDTFLIQEQSWAVIRFVADNPGVWLFHCHIDWHGLSGMAVTFIEARERFVRDVKLTHEAKRICELWRSGSSSSSGSNLGLMWYKSDISSYFYSCNSLLLYFVYFVSFMSVSRIFPVAIISIKNINAANCK